MEKNDTVNRFEKEINEIFNDCDVKGKLPVPLVGIANHLGYVVYRFKPTFETINVSGVVNYDDNEILLNELDFSRRQRFTLAHEIGHIVLEHQENGEKLDYREDMIDILNPRGERERSANQFAAELLMPLEDFVRKFEEVNKSNNLDYREIISELAEYFLTSCSATKIRAKELKLNVSML